MNKKSNIIVGLAIVGVALVGAGWWAFSGHGSGTKAVGGAGTTGVFPVAEVSGGSGGSGSGEGSQGSSTSSGSGSFVASKNGSKYFPIDCGSAKTIKEENKIYFQTAESAQSAGMNWPKTAEIEEF